MLPNRYVYVIMGGLYDRAMPSATSSGRKSGPSIEDVARLAGVSAQTVSRVSTGAAPVRDATKARVLAAMDQLGYSPNKAARALRSGTFGTIGVMAHRFERTGESLTTAGVIEAAQDQDIAVTLLTVSQPQDDQWQRTAQRITQQSIDGLVVIRGGEIAAEALALPAGLPVAVSDSWLAGRYSAAISDQMQGSLAAITHLLDLGHRAIHHIAGPVESQAAVVRTAAWRRRMEEAGLQAPRPWPGDWTAESGYRVGREIAADPTITAVFCANDEMAFGLMRALHENDLRVPQDVSVIGVDGIELSEFSSPPLTTVKQDFALMGHELVRLVMDQVRHQASHERVLIPTTLLVRATTAPPGR